MQWNVSTIWHTGQTVLDVITVNKPIKVRGDRVVRCRTCDREVVGSIAARGCCVPKPTKHTIPLGSVNEYQRKLGSKRAHHAMHWPRIRGLAASAGVRLMAKETEISAAPWALEARERTLLLYIQINQLSIITFCI